MLSVVITTIQSPTPCVVKLANHLADSDASLVVAGDTKGPSDFDLSETDFHQDRVTFLSIDDQLNSGFEIAERLPTKHYCRKNVGYLHAMRAGATCIYETDDDNMPLDHWFQRDSWLPDLRFVRSSGTTAPQWINVYKHFTDGLIWPRGLPLDQIREGSQIVDLPDSQVQQARRQSGEYWAPIQQGLADGAPDVDAVWRLTVDREFNFDSAPSVMLGPGQWCPFNTQTTWWWPVVYPLLYVPSYCSFRMCDIWKSFVAQRCLWELGTGVVFHASEVVQQRNPHNLMRDFEDEIPGYLKNHQLASLLESLSLLGGESNVAANLRLCYEELVSHGVFPEKELELVDAWISDVEAAVVSTNSLSPGGLPIR